MDGRLRLQVSDADAERLAVLADDRRTEFLQLDVEDMITSQVCEAPSGPGWSLRLLRAPCWRLLASPLMACPRRCL